MLFEHSGHKLQRFEDLYALYGVLCRCSGTVVTGNIITAATNSI